MPKRFPHCAILTFACLLTFTGSGCQKTSVGRAVPPNYQPQEGDIVFQSLNGSELGTVIEAATKSAYSHCGIVTQTGDQWKVLEAIGPVQEVPLADWIERGREGKVAVYRLKPAYRNQIPPMIQAARTYRGKPYDIQYEFDDEKIYCSELIFKAFKQATGEELGKAVSLGELDWRGHEAFIRRITGGSLPLDRKMITPADLARATQLELVPSN